MPESTPSAEARRRRTFAIISHPDAGKTTLTEKLLLYGGALVEAGSVESRKGRRASTSDWMDMERRRGISVTSTALHFTHDGIIFNLLDTPGHSDFSEDTLRVMSAVDAAVILIDAARGIESQTLRLFEVARSRGIPLITFVNKCDRPGMEPLAMIDHIEKTLEVIPTAATWPVGEPGRMLGIVDRRADEFHRFERVPGGSEIAPSSAEAVEQARDDTREEWRTAVEELGLLEQAGHTLDAEAVSAGIATPVFFGSALTNFGVELLLDAVQRLAPSPHPRADVDGVERPLDSPFSGLVFKVQANMDPRHRDRSAFIRICSGRFERGARVTNARTGRVLALNYASETFGRKRDTVEEGFPGDVIGVVNAADLQVGDTVFEGEEVRYPPLPTLVPEHFIRIRNREAQRHKQFNRGLTQLAEEGVVHVLTEEGGRDPAPVLGAVGQLQFEVALERMKSEFGVEVASDPTNWKLARRTDAESAAQIREEGHADLRTRSDGTIFALFRSQFQLDRLQASNPGLRLDQVL